ncbi:hypothetical protein [Tahibacter amnicola]|uniref:Uncharacterized protein n=1 Tax=Tahibacter amnicola TaxID=2976241 RepID=A0ABY6BHI2_9GAMM|nr:hypothetical protein [Tahibacter amnicola]UXI68051.1 hypothetical protein N4264_25550 [Tahibacter amnicola]
MADVRPVIAAIPTMLSHAGGALFSVVRHVVVRCVFWGLVGAGTALLAWLVSLLIGALVLESGVRPLLSGGWLLVPFVLMAVAGVAFAVHGFARGLARAALDLEQRVGVVNRVVDAIAGLLESRIGGRLTDLPLARWESNLKDVSRQYLATDASARGLSAWVWRRVERRVVSMIDTGLLSAYRAEVSATGGGGVEIGKVAGRVKEELSGALGERLMAPLNFQRLLLFAATFLVGIGWFGLVRLVAWAMRAAQ